MDVCSETLQRSPDLQWLKLEPKETEPGNTCVVGRLDGIDCWSCSTYRPISEAPSSGAGKGLAPRLGVSQGSQRPQAKSYVHVSLQDQVSCAAANEWLCFPAGEPEAKRKASSRDTRAHHGAGR